MTVVRSAVLALIALPAMGTAAPPPAVSTTPRAAAATPLALAPGAKRGVMSAEGRATAARIYGTPDPRIAELQSQITALRQQRAMLIASPPIDLEKLDPMLRQEELLQTELRTRNNDRLMLLLRSLPENDRVVVLQNMANPAKPQSSAAKPAAAN